MTSVVETEQVFIATGNFESNRIRTGRNGCTIVDRGLFKLPRETKFESVPELATAETQV